MILWEKKYIMSVVMMMVIVKNNMIDFVLVVILLIILVKLMMWMLILLFLNCLWSLFFSFCVNVRVFNCLLVLGFSLSNCVVIMV